MESRQTPRWMTMWEPAPLGKWKQNVLHFSEVTWPLSQQSSLTTASCNLNTRSPLVIFFFCLQQLLTPQCAPTTVSASVNHTTCYSNSLLVGLLFPLLETAQQFVPQYSLFFRLSETTVVLFSHISYTDYLFHIVSHILCTQGEKSILAFTFVTF